MYRCSVFFQLILLISASFCHAQPVDRFAGRRFEPVKFSNWLEAVDVDGDGDVDFVSSSFNIVSTIANNGGAGFEVVATTDLGNSSFIKDFAVGDFDGDSDTDVVVLDFGVKFLANDGTGQYQLAGEFPAAGNPEEFAVADFDGDSDLDLVLAYLFEERIEIWLNDGNGGFAVSETYDPSHEPWGVVAGDLDGDGNPDIVFADLHFDSVGVMYGAGDGTFADAIGIATGSAAPFSVALGDIDNDSDLDIVTGNFDETVGLVRNDGNRNFQSLGSYLCGGRPESLKLVDLDNDQFSEIVVSSSKTNSVLYNNRDESFTTVVNKDQSRGGLAIADFDSDGDSDFAVPTGHLYLNRGDGELDTRTCYPLDGDTTEMVSGDLNDDGLQDIAVADASSNSVVVFLSNCDGELELPQFYYGGEKPTNLAIGDMNGDGELDLVTGNADGDEVHVLLNFGEGVFPQAIKHVVPGNGFSIAVGDVDSDGNLDVVVPGVEQISFLLNIGDGMLQNPISIGAPDGAFEAVIGDINGDGFNVVIVNGFAGTVSVFQILDDLIFVSDPIYQPLTDFTRVNLVDIDNDGDLDIGLTFGTELEVMLNNGDGTFAGSPSIDTGFSVTQATFGDIDGDQLADAIAIYPEGRVSVFKNLGGGLFGDRVNYSVGEFPIDLAVADVNGDQRQDIAVLNHRNPWQGISLLIQRSGFPVEFGIPDSLDVFRGNQESGTIEDLFQSDDSRLVMQPGYVLNNSEAPVWLVVESSVGIKNDLLILTLESNAGTPGLTSTIEVWNWVSESYQVTDVSQASFNNDIVISIDMTAKMSQFIRPGCPRVRARVGWRKTGFTINFPWEVRIDRLAWELE